jgi:DDE superfamily endonuclease
MLFFFSSPPFYTTYVHQPTAEDPCPHKIQSDTKFYPFFKDTVGAIDGSHISSSHISSVLPAENCGSFRNRKGGVSQNCLFTCSFDMLFNYVLTGWEGSASDARVYEDAQANGLNIPKGKYLLADAGYAHCDELLTPYRGIRYHIKEWGCVKLRWVFC